MERILAGDSIAQAGREAGYSESVLRSRIYEIRKSPGVQNAIETHKTQPKPATKTIDKVRDAVAVGQAKADFMADVDDLMKLAEANGEKLTQDQARELLIPIYESTLGKPLLDVTLGAVNEEHSKEDNLEAAIAEFIEIARKVGIQVSRDIALLKLAPLFLTS